MEAPLRAIIYIPPGVDVERWQKACLKHCARRGYEVVALVIEPAGRWVDVIRIIARGEAEVIVVFDWTKLEETRVPRIEEVGIENSGDIPRSRRPRLFRSR